MRGLPVLQEFLANRNFFLPVGWGGIPFAKIFLRGGPNGLVTTARKSGCVKFNRPSCSGFDAESVLSKPKN